MIAVFDITFGRDYVYFSQVKIGGKFRCRFPEYTAYGVLEKVSNTSAKDVFTGDVVDDIASDKQVYGVYGAKPLNL